MRYLHLQNLSFSKLFLAFSVIFHTKSYLCTHSYHSHFQYEAYDSPQMPIAIELLDSFVNMLGPCPARLILSTKRGSPRGLVLVENYGSRTESVLGIHWVGRSFLA